MVKDSENDNRIKTKLPERIPIETKEIRKEEDDEDELRLIDDFRHFTKQRIFKWDPNYKNFSFDLPETKFTEDTIIKYELYNNLEIEYGGNERNLNSQQFSEIWQNGQFSVNSKIDNLPYVWKLSQWTVKGIHNIKDSFNSDLSWSYYFLYALKHRFTMNNYNQYVFSFPSSFYGILNGLWYTVDLLIGLKNGTKERNIYHIEKEIKRKYILNLLKEFPQIDPHIFTLKDHNIFLNLTESFNTIWDKEFIYLDNEMYDQNVPLNERKIKLRDERNSRYVDYLMQSQNFSNLNDSKKKLLVDFFLALVELSKVELEFNEKMIRSKEEIISELTRDYPIKSKIEEWMNINVEERMNEVKIKLITEKDNKLSINIQKYEVPTILMNENRLYQSNYQRELEEKSKDIPYVDLGNEYNYVKRFYIPPYPISESMNDYTGQMEYQMEKFTYHKVESTFILWRLWLFLVRYYCWTYNVIIFFLITSLNSGFGLKALWSNKIYTNQNVNHNSGEIEYTEETFTYRSVVSNLFKWISDSREEFESSPDTGLFGKNFSRLFNIINNYIIKLIFLGTICVFIYPLIILLYTILAIILALTAPIWMLGVMILFQLFIITIYDFDGKSFKCPLAPILTYSIYLIIYTGVIQLILTVIIFIMQPILSLFMFILGFVRCVLRFLYDCFMYLIVRCLAKLPSSNSAVAWKISGPGISMRQYNHITMEDAMTFIHGKLEEEELKHFKTRVIEILNEPQVYKETRLNPLLSRVNLTLSGIEHNIRPYCEILEKQILKRKSFYPIVDSVKFTQEELESLKTFAVEYMREYILKNEMNYIWSEYQLPQDSFTRLTEALLCKTFGEDILEPLEEADFRVELKKTFNNSYNEMKNKLFDIKKLEKFSLKIKNRDVIMVKLPKLVSLTCIRNENPEFYLNIHDLDDDDKFIIFGRDYKIVEI